MRTISTRLEDSIYKERGEMMDALKRLEASRKQSIESFDYEKEREEAMNIKYGNID